MLNVSWTCHEMMVTVRWAYKNWAKRVQNNENMSIIFFDLHSHEILNASDFVVMCSTDTQQYVPKDLKFISFFFFFFVVKTIQKSIKTFFCWPSVWLRYSMMGYPSFNVSIMCREVCKTCKSIQDVEQNVGFC